MEQLSLPFAYELKNGDKVKILGKTVGGPLEGFVWFKKGQVAYIHHASKSYRGNFNNYFLSLIKGGRSYAGAFIKEDLRKVWG